MSQHSCECVSVGMEAMAQDYTVERTVGCMEVCNEKLAA